MLGNINHVSVFAVHVRTFLIHICGGWGREVVYLWPCSLGNLGSPIRDQTKVLSSENSANHWTTRDSHICVSIRCVDTFPLCWWWWCSATKSCLTLCDPMDCSTPGLPVHHQLLELAQTHAHWVGDAIQPSHPLSSPSPPAFSLSQHQGLFQWVGSVHQVAKILKHFQNLSPMNFLWSQRELLKSDFAVNCRLQVTLYSSRNLHDPSSLPANLKLVTTRLHTSLSSTSVERNKTPFILVSAVSCFCFFFKYSKQFNFLKLIFKKI